MPRKAKRWTVPRAEGKNRQIKKTQKTSDIHHKSIIRLKINMTSRKIRLLEHLELEAVSYIWLYKSTISTLAHYYNNKKLLIISRGGGNTRSSVMILS